MRTEQVGVKPEAFIRLGSYSPDDAQNLDSLEDSLCGYLYFNPRGKVYVFLEQGFYDHRISQHVSDRVASGYPLSYVLAEIDFVSTYVRVPTKHEVLRHVKNFFRNPENRFIAKKAQIVDRMQLEFLPKNGNGHRIGVITEETPEDELKVRVQGRKRYDKDTQEALDYALSGEFDKGLLSFKDSIIYLAEGARTREPRMIAKICEYLQKDDTIAVVATLGTAHTSVVHGIRKRGFMARYDLVEQEDELFLFDPGVALVRKCTFSGVDSVSPLDWRRGFLGDACYRLINSANYDLNADLSKQKMSRMAFAFIHNLSTPEGIDDFERKVRKNGFLESIEAACLAPC